MLTMPHGARPERSLRAAAVVLLALLAACVALAVTAGGANAATGTVTVTAQAQTPLTSEFAGGPAATITSGSCNPTGDSVYTFEISSPVSGPYPGTFTASGSVTVGPQVDEIPGAPGQYRGPITAFEASFTITSPAGVVTGTQSLVPDSAANYGVCVFGAAQITASQLTYQATLPGGWTDRGTTWANFNAYPPPGDGSLLVEFRSAFTSQEVTPPGGADTEPPDTSIDSGPSGTTNSTAASFAFSSPDSGASFECRRMDGVSGAWSSWSPCSSPQVDTGMSEGEHTFEVRAIDTAGNVDPTPASAVWTVSSVPPDSNRPPIAASDRISNGGPTNVLANDSDPDSDPLTLISWTQPEVGTADCTPAGDCTTTILDYDWCNAPPSGNTSFTYTVSDGRGGTAVGVVRQITVVACVPANEPPQVSVTGIVDGSTYSHHPTPGCSVVDREDGIITGVLPVRTGPVDGTFTVTCSYTDFGGKTGTSTVTYTLASAVGNADLALTKTGPVTAHAGEELTYLIRVKNNGPDIATDVQVVDTLPAGLDFVSVVPAAPVCTGTVTIVCGLGTLAVGEVKAVTIVARGRVPGPVHNDAAVTANETDPKPGDNTAGWNTDVGPALANVTISKAARILTGPRLRYTIDVENLGPTVATGVIAKDVLDPTWALIDVTTTQGSCTGRVICSIGTLAVNQKETVTITIGLTTPGPVHNDATVGWDGGGIATAGVTSPPFPDLRISKAHVGNFKAGQTGSYSLSISNIGTGPTTSDIIVADTLPAGMTFDSSDGGGFTCAAVDRLVTCTRVAPLAAGDSVSFTLRVLVATDAPPLVTNVAKVTGGGGVYQLDGASDPGGVLPPPVLGLAKRVKERTIRVGHNLTYLIDVTNTGGQDATNVRVIDTLPASVDLVSINPGAPTCNGTTTITCRLGDLPVGQTVTVEIVVRPRLLTLLTNQAFATADGIVVPATGSVSTEVLPPPDLGITKEASAPVVVQDSLLRYTITAKNLGPGDATNVKINDPLPTGVTLVSVQPDPTYAMTCNVSAPPEITNLSGPVVCTIPVLPELTTSKVVLVVRVVRFGPLANTATVSSDDPDPGSGNDAATVTVLVNRPPTANAGGPYTVPEGGSVRLSGAGSDPDGDAFTFAWDLDGDAIFETGSQNPVFSAATLDGPSVKTVSLRVCDTKGACTIKATTVTITNVAPQIIVRDQQRSRPDRHSRADLCRGDRRRGACEGPAALRVRLRQQRDLRGRPAGQRQRSVHLHDRLVSTPCGRESPMATVESPSVRRTYSSTPSRTPASS